MHNAHTYAKTIFQNVQNPGVILGMRPPISQTIITQKPIKYTKIRMK